MDTKPADLPKTSESAAQANAPTDPNSLHVKVWSPFRIYFDGSAASISAVNLTGPFDILPRHHNFITLLIPSDLSLVTRDGPLKIRISGGIMHVAKNFVKVFLEV